MDGPVQYVKIVGWSDHLHPDLTRKVKPPFRWIKLQTENLDTLGDLTLREFGAYCRLLSLAALTDNRVVFNARAIKRRTGITPKDIEKLQNRGLVRITDESHAPEKNQRNQGRDLETASGFAEIPPQSAALEGKGSEEIGSDLNRGDAIRGLSPRVEDTTSLSPPLPGSQRNRHDPRSFDELKAFVLRAATTLNSRDPDQIHKLAGQSLRMSRKQVATATQQLIQDGKL